MNIRAECVVFSMAAAVFYSHGWAGEAGRNVAMQDLSLKPLDPVVQRRGH